MPLQLVSHISPELYTHSHVMDVDINIFDTDCYGVMWHGAYTKWMEIGRVKLLEAEGYTFSAPNDPEGYIFPVADQQFKFKHPAYYGQSLCLTTQLAVKRYKLHFLQTFTLVESDNVAMEAFTTIVVLDANWRVQRKLPESLRVLLGID